MSSNEPASSDTVECTLTFSIDISRLLQVARIYGPLFTLERLTHIARERQRLIDRQGRGEYTALDIWGQECAMRVSAPIGSQVAMNPDAYWSIEIRYNHLQQLSDSRFKHLHYCPFLLEEVAIPLERRCEEYGGLLHDEVSWNNLWWDSPFYRDLSAHLEMHAATMARVDQIICIGLGCPVGASPAASYERHIAAYTVGKILSKEQGRNIRIFAQDSLYCEPGIHFLLSRFNIIVLEDPEGVCSMDMNTFVISAAPCMPVRQLALSFCEPTGPAGMLCDSIVDDGMQLDGLSYTHQPMQPPNQQSSSRWHADSSSPDVLKFANESWKLEGLRWETGREAGVYLRKGDMAWAS